MSRNADNFYFRAKEKGYRSRAAFKLLEMQKKYGFMRENLTILEIGSSPGGWTDVIMDWKPAKLICVDIAGHNSSEDPVEIKGDIRNDFTWEKISGYLGNIPIDLILSDAMAHTSGQHHRDHGMSMELCTSIMDRIPRFLKPGGAVVMKQFQGDMTESFIKKYSGSFRKAFRTKPPASRLHSSEIYIIFSGFHL
ncbi:MAG: RlmE family RNA methyltransferase [Candidatus Thermoplasmatota archaeon]|jgi:23S rRNA (uridine2552-2'-O)-methyltransferase|nr:RlmE family RNA methyltransferase [Candidatus Thermoplasmatota archaeon]